MKSLLTILILSLSINLFSQILNNVNIDKVTERNKIEKEIKRIDSLIALYPERSTFYLIKSDILFEQKSFIDGINLLDEAIGLLPDSANLYEARGYFLMVNGIHDKALEDYNDAYDKAQNDSIRYSYLFNRGTCKYYTRDFEGALEDFIALTKRDSSDIYIYNNIALVYDELSKPEEALKYLKMIVEKDSMFATGYNNIGLHYQQLEEHKKAIDFFNKAIEIEPDMAFAYSNRSFSMLKLNKVKQAIIDIEYSLKLYPINSYAYKIRALIYIKKGKTEKACDDLAKALYYRYTEQYGEEVNELILEHCK